MKKRNFNYWLNKIPECFILCAFDPNRIVYSIDLLSKINGIKKVTSYWEDRKEWLHIKIENNCNFEILEIIRSNTKIAEYDIITKPRNKMIKKKKIEFKEKNECIIKK